MVSISAQAPPQLDSVARAPRADAAAYRAARRHSRLVRFLRWAIPAGATASLAAFVVWPFLAPLPASVSIGAVRLDGTRVTMENPRLSGHRRDNRPFEVTAVSATQDIRRPTIIDMSQMTANMVSSDSRRLSLSARSATYDTQREQLQLRDEIRIRTEGGQAVNLISADVDFKAGTVRSRDPVEVRMPDMTVRADGLDVVDSGGLISFTGRVSALIEPPAAAATDSAAGRSSAPVPNPR